MELEYVKISDDAWNEVRESALTTIHKKHTGTEITHEWKKAILKSEHSPIRDMVIRAKFTNMPRFVADQLVRHHIGFQPYMGTWRPDRGCEKPRSEQTMKDPTVLRLVLNAHALINISRERLCTGASQKTREAWKMLLKELSKIEPELVFYCVPSCINRAGCKEFKPCEFFTKYLLKVTKECPNKALATITNIDKRYEQYHKYFSL